MISVKPEPKQVIEPDGRVFGLGNSFELESYEEL